MVLPIFLGLVVLTGHALAQPSADCIEANSSFFMNLGCISAFSNLVSGNGSVADTASICGSGQQCYGLLTNITNACQGEQSDEDNVGFIRPLLCAVDSSTGNDCWAYVSGSSGLDAGQVFEQCIFSYLSGSCESTCQMAVTSQSNAGCCANELYDASYNAGLINSQHYNFAVRSVYETCQFNSSFCDGRPLPARSECDNAVTMLYSSNDQCAMATRSFVQSQFEGDFGFLFIEGCAVRFQSFLLACRSLLGNETDELSRYVNASADLSRAVNANGQSCSIAGQQILSSISQYEQVDCVADFYARNCSTGCSEFITNLRQEHGCCVNNFQGFYLGLSSEFDDQLAYIVYTQEIFDICGIQSLSFCQGERVPYSASATTCAASADAFFGNNACWMDFRALVEHLSLNQTVTAADSICSHQSCKNHIPVYTKYLLDCRLGINEQYQDENFGHLAYISGNTTCKTHNNISCYAVNTFSQEIDQVTGVLGDPFGVCSSALQSGTNATCSNMCNQTLQTAFDAVACCLSEYINALLGSERLTQLATVCGSFVNTRCVEQQAVDSGGASVKVTMLSAVLGIVAILVLII